jgi:hypothetical protein
VMKITATTEIFQGSTQIPIQSILPNSVPNEFDRT